MSLPTESNETVQPTESQQLNVIVSPFSDRMPARVTLEYWPSHVACSRLSNTRQLQNEYQLKSFLEAEYQLALFIRVIMAQSQPRSFFTA